MTVPADALAWAAEGGDVFNQALAGVDDDAFGAPGTLPGWTTGHVVAHVAYNAQALQRLVHWARTGEKTPMYASFDARNAEIDRGSTLPPAELRSLARDTDAALRADLAGLPVTAWTAEVVTAQGRTVPASEVPWMRTREAWIHAVDLGTGVGFDRFPAHMVDRLLTELAGQRAAAGRGPALVLTATDRDRTWTVDGDDPVHVTGPAAGLARWLTGRGTADVTAEPGALPDIGRWL